MTYEALAQLGVPVHHRDLDEVLRTIDEFVEIGRSTGKAHQVVTVNTDFIVQANKYEDIHAILRSADLAIPDGMPIVWASAALGQRLPRRIAGADLVGLIAERAAETGYRVLFFGGTDDVGERAAEILRAEYPGLDVLALTGMVGADGETDPELLAQIRAYGPDIACVALGHPKQERWVRRYGAALGIPVGIGVGGTFDFIAGEKRRAAPWIQNSGLEWLYRLAQEPRRLTGRYLTDMMVFLPRIAIQIASTRSVGGLRRLARRGVAIDDVVDIVHTTDDNVVVALRSHGPLDYRSAAALASLATRLRRQGRRVQLVMPDRRAVASITRLRLDRLVVLVPDRAARPAPEAPRPTGHGSRARAGSHNEPTSLSG